MNKDNKLQVTILDPIHEAIDRFNKIIVAIVVVLVIGFITMLLMVAGLVLDAWRFKSNSYESLMETIKSQQQIIESNKIQNNDIMSALEKLDKKIQPTSTTP